MLEEKCHGNNPAIKNLTEQQKLCLWKLSRNEDTLFCNDFLWHIRTNMVDSYLSVLCKKICTQPDFRETLPALELKQIKDEYKNKHNLKSVREKARKVIYSKVKAPEKVTVSETHKAPSDTRRFSNVIKVGL